MNVIKKIFYIFDNKQKIRFAELILIMLLGAILELAGVATIMPFVKVISTPEIIHSNSLYSSVYTSLGCNDDIQFILFLAFALIAIYIGKNIYIIFMYDCQFRFTYNNQRRIAMKMMDCYMKQPYIFHVKKNISELQRNMQTDVDMLMTAVQSFIQLFSEAVVCILLCIYLILLDKTISVGVIIVLLIFAFLFLKVTKKKSLKLGEIKRQNASEMNKWIRQSFEGIKDIKILDRASFFYKHVDEAYRVLGNSTRKSSIINVLPRPIFEATCFSAVLLVVVFKILRGVNLNYFIPVMATFAVAAMRLLPSFGRIATYINEIVFNIPAVDNVYNDLWEVELLKNYIFSQQGISEELELRECIYINNVSFSYGENLSPVIIEASVQIKKNSSVAFIGQSGAGKTTIVDIILGLLKPQQGEILVDDKDIFEYERGWHEIIGYIPQTIYLIDDTIKNNILFGTDAKEADDSKVWAALESAQLGEFVRQLEDGVDTVVGERGVRLSGGQRQRIGIARALYNDPQVLVLDEATSALDNETERAVMDAIDKLKGSRTMIIIAHRLTTIKNCDEIYEVIDGKIVKRTKAELF